MSLDPIGTWGDAENLGNPYAYVGNNPGSRRDPTGLYGWGDFWDDAADFGTAVTAFVPCGCTEWAREDVRRSYADFDRRDDVAAPVRILASVFGPPQTTSEAVLALGLAAIPGGGAGGKAAAGPTRAAADLGFAGVRELSATLRGAGVVRAERLQIINAFEVGSITAKSATPGESFFRFWGGDARETGRYLTRGVDEAADATQTLALPRGNSAEHLTEFTMKPGTRIFEGRVASQWGLRGGGEQVFVPDPGALVRQTRWR